MRPSAEQQLASAEKRNWQAAAALGAHSAQDSPSAPVCTQLARQLRKSASAGGGAAQAAVSSATSHAPTRHLGPAAAARTRTLKDPMSPSPACTLAPPRGIIAPANAIAHRSNGQVRAPRNTARSDGVGQRAVRAPFARAGFAAGRRAAFAAA